MILHLLIAVALFIIYVLILVFWVIVAACAVLIPVLVGTFLIGGWPAVKRILTGR